MQLCKNWERNQEEPVIILQPIDLVEKERPVHIGDEGVKIFEYEHAGGFGSSALEDLSNTWSTSETTSDGTGNACSPNSSPAYADQLHQPSVQRKARELTMKSLDIQHRHLHLLHDSLQADRLSVSGGLSRTLDISFLTSLRPEHSRQGK